MADADKVLENEVNSELEVVAQIIRNETEDNSPHCSEFVADSNQDDEMPREHNRDQHFSDMRIIGPWCDVVTDIDYCQDSTTSDLEQDFGSDRRQLILGAPAIPVAVQKDMNFLRQSWDNIVEVDVNQPFQMAVSKKKKKNQKLQAEVN
jgi:hypothetical protein